MTGVCVCINPTNTQTEQYSLDIMVSCYCEMRLRMTDITSVHHDVSKTCIIVVNHFTDISAFICMNGTAEHPW